MSDSINLDDISSLVRSLFGKDRIDSANKFAAMMGLLGDIDQSIEARNEQ